MINSKKLNRLFSFRIVALFLAVFAFSQLSANSIYAPQSSANEILDLTQGNGPSLIADFASTLDLEMMEAAKIKIKIIIIIIKKKKKVFEIQDIQLAGKEKPGAKNAILAEASVSGNKFIIMPIRDSFNQSETLASSLLVVRQGFKVSPEVSMKLEHEGRLILKEGKFEYKVGQLGNFEIQD